MDFNEYQKESRKTVQYPESELKWTLAFLSLGLTGESGEVADHIKKVIRDDGGEVTEERRATLKKELGDILWYIAQMASELNLLLDDIAQGNIDKLTSRMERGVIQGEGGDR